MKKITLSKTSRMILLAGVFLVVLGVLVFSFLQQSERQTYIENELANAEARLQQLDTGALEATLKELQEQLTSCEQELAQSVEALQQQSVISADVAEEFYRIAEEKLVTVEIFESTEISAETIEGINVLQTNTSATVSASLTKLIDFATSLNDGFAAGYLTEAWFSVQDNTYEGPSLSAPASLNLTMTVYTVGEADGR